MWFRQQQNCGFSAVAVHHVRRHFLRDGEAHPHGLCGHEDSPFAVLERGDRRLCRAGRAGLLVFDSHLYGIRCSPEEYKMLIFWEMTLPVDTRSASVYEAFLMSLVCRSCRFPCRGAEAYSHGQNSSDHRDFSVA